MTVWLCSGSITQAASFKHVSPAGAAIGTELSDEERLVFEVKDKEITPTAAAYVLGTLPLKLGHKCGVFGFLRQKNVGKKIVPPHPDHFLKIQWEINFFKCPFFGTQPSTKILNRSYIAFYQKTAFGFNPRPWEVPEPENTQTRVFAYIMCFLVRALPEVRDRMQTQFLDKVLYIHGF